MISIRNLPLTKIKIIIAKWIYAFFTLANLNRIRRVVRGGVQYELDLSEGIDLSIFLFGNFQNHILAKKYIDLPIDAVIFDVGANIGAMTLPYAKIIKGRGKVFSFEPTDYAYKKLMKNISLNSELSKSIVVRKCFVSSSATENSALKAFSSWKLDNQRRDLHPVHLGSAMSTESTPSITLDMLAREEALQRVDYIKIDTDGHEMDVLHGAKEVLTKFRPVVIFECGQYLLKERNQDVRDYIYLFDSLGYHLFNLSNDTKLNLDNILKEVPTISTIDIIALPR